MKLKPDAADFLLRLPLDRMLGRQGLTGLQVGDARMAAAESDSKQDCVSIPTADASPFFGGLPPRTRPPLPLILILSEVIFSAVIVSAVEKAPISCSCCLN